MREGCEEDRNFGRPTEVEAWRSFAQNKYGRSERRPLKCTKANRRILHAGGLALNPHLPPDHEEEAWMWAHALVMSIKLSRLVLCTDLTPAILRTVVSQSRNDHQGQPGEASGG
jgi:hypothetical protein